MAVSTPEADKKYFHATLRTRPRISQLQLIMTNRSSDDECKPGAVRQEKLDTTHSYADTDVDGIEEKRIVRKIDWRLLPILGALYSISLVSPPCIGLSSSSHRS